MKADPLLAIAIAAVVGILLYTLYFVIQLAWRAARNRMALGAASPAKRLAIVAFLAGLTLFAVGCVGIAANTSYFGESVARAIEGRGHWWHDTATQVGFWIALSGAALWFLARPFGRLLTWIVRGN